MLWGKCVAVDWAEPEPIVEEEILSKVRFIFILMNEQMIPAQIEKLV